MQRDISELLLVAADECSRMLDKSLKIVMTTCDEVKFKSYRKLVARAMGYVFTEIMAPIYVSDPELEPEWLKSKHDSSSYIRQPDKDDIIRIWPDPGPIRRDVAETIIDILNEVINKLEATIVYVREHCSNEESDRYARRINEEVFVHVVGAKKFVFIECPYLKPDHEETVH